LMQSRVATLPLLTASNRRDTSKCKGLEQVGQGRVSACAAGCLEALDQVSHNRNPLLREQHDHQKPSKASFLS
jgi:hypothetical protein